MTLASVASPAPIVSTTGSGSGVAGRLTLIPNRGENVAPDLPRVRSTPSTPRSRRAAAIVIIVAAIEQAGILVTELDQGRSRQGPLEALPEGVEIADQPRPHIWVEDSRAFDVRESVAEGRHLCRVLERERIDCDERRFRHGFPERRVERDATPEHRRREMVARLAVAAARRDDAGEIDIRRIEEATPSWRR